MMKKLQDQDELLAENEAMIEAIEAAEVSLRAAGKTVPQRPDIAGDDILLTHELLAGHIAKLTISGSLARAAASAPKVSATNAKPAATSPKASQSNFTERAMAANGLPRPATKPKPIRADDSPTAKALKAAGKDPQAEVILNDDINTGRYA